MQFIEQLKIKLFYKKVGMDEFGNSYYQNKDGKRFVVYKGIAEPSKIPAQWHSWIHYSCNILPVNIKTDKFSWQKIHLPNLTGTKNAYSPKKYAQKTKKYQSWQPN
jgi:NADH dehydrogenase